MTMSPFLLVATTAFEPPKATQVRSVAIQILPYHLINTFMAKAA